MQKAPHWFDLSTWAVLFAAQVFFLISAPQVLASSSTTEGSEQCLSCHDGSTDQIGFGDKSKRSVNVPRKDWLNSVHGGQLSCTDCHREITGYPHRKNKAEDSRDYTIQKANTCQRCHYAHYTRILDGIHYQVLQAGMREAPTCVDCHGSHAIKNPKEPRIAISRACGKCHSAIVEIYSKSVHGKVLVQDNNHDVPTCTDCHGAHAVVGPNKADFRVGSYKTCATCHSDKKKMEKYGLNADVLDTYLDDFHGASNRLYAKGAGTPGKPIASCSDCHGVHDIKSLRNIRPDGSAQRAAKEQVVKSCQRCHAGVTPAFADAWLSHYKPTLQNAPLVWGVKMFYRFVIPLIVLGLVLHILLHLWRWKTHR